MPAASHARDRCWPVPALRTSALRSWPGRGSAPCQSPTAACTRDFARLISRSSSPVGLPGRTRRLVRSTAAGAFDRISSCCDAYAQRSGSGYLSCMLAAVTTAQVIVPARISLPDQVSGHGPEGTVDSSIQKLYRPQCDPSPLEDIHVLLLATISYCIRPRVGNMRQFCIGVACSPDWSD
jgi:hypothetical protein